MFWFALGAAPCQLMYFRNVMGVLKARIFHGGSNGIHRGQVMSCDVYAEMSHMLMVSLFHSTSALPVNVAGTGRYMFK